MPRSLRLLSAGRNPFERQSRSGALIDQEEKAGLRRNDNLRVIPRGHEVTVSFRKSRVQLIGSLESSAQDRCAEAMEVAAARVENQQALSAEHSGIELSEGLREGAVRPIGGSQGLHRVGVTEQLPGLIDQRSDCLIEHDAANRDRGLRSLPVHQSAELAACGKSDVIDLGEIVIFRREPEDGYVRLPILRGAPRPGEGCGSLQGGKERSTEKAHLLAGDHNARACPERIDRGAGGRSGILGGEQIDELRPMRREREAALPVCLERDKAIERLDRCLACAEVGVQPVLPRRHGNGMTVGEMQIDHFPFVCMVSPEGRTRLKTGCVKDAMTGLIDAASETPGLPGPLPLRILSQNPILRRPLSMPKRVKAPRKPAKPVKKARPSIAPKKKAPKRRLTEVADLISSEVVFECPLFRVRHDKIIEPGGRKAERDVIRHNGSVVILALDNSRSKKDPWVVIERQYRHAANQYLWELPAGKLDGGEEPLAGAQRELEEETGYRAKKWRPLVEYYASPGFLGESMKVFVAEGLIPGDAHPEEDEQIEMRLVRMSDLIRMIEKGAILDGKTLTSVLLYARLLTKKRNK